MVIKNKFCLIGAFVIPLALIAYFAVNMSLLSKTLVPIQATLNEFITKGSHSNYRKVAAFDEYPASFVRYYEGANMLFVKDQREVIYEPPPPGEIKTIYDLHPQLKVKNQRQFSFFIQIQDRYKLMQNGAPIPYFYLQALSVQRSKLSYYMDLYLYVYQNNYGAGVLFVSVLLFAGCCMGASWWYEQNKMLLAYAIIIVILHGLLFVL